MAEYISKTEKRNSMKVKLSIIPIILICSMLNACSCNTCNLSKCCNISSDNVNLKKLDVPIDGRSQEVLIPNYSKALKPHIKKMDYTVDEGKIIILFTSNRIVIDTNPFEHQTVTVIKDNAVQLKQELKYLFDARYVNGIYSLSLPSSETPFLLISSSVVGCSGYSANMSHGLLIDFSNEKPIVQTLSTWGLVEDNFVDVGHTGRYYFVCIDFQVNGLTKLFIPNYFSLSHNKFINVTRNEMDFKCYIDEKNDGKWIDGKSAGVKLLANPDMIKIP